MWNSTNQEIRISCPL